MFMLNIYFFNILDSRKHIFSKDTVNRLKDTNTFSIYKKKQSKSTYKYIIKNSENPSFDILSFLNTYLMI